MKVKFRVHCWWLVEHAKEAAKGIIDEIGCSRPNFLVELIVWLVQDFFLINDDDIKIVPICYLQFRASENLSFGTDPGCCVGRSLDVLEGVEPVEP